MYCDILTKDVKEKAKQLGYSQVYVLGETACLLKSKSKPKQTDLYKAVQKARKKYKLVIVQGVNETFNRAAIEAKPDLLLSPHSQASQARIDKVHARDSGLGRVICKLASQNSVSIGISLNEILQVRGEERALLLGRIMQNIRLCRKYCVDVLLASFGCSRLGLRNPQDLRAFGESLGMSPAQARKALTVAAEIVRRNENREAEITKGVRVVK